MLRRAEHHTTLSRSRAPVSPHQLATTTLPPSSCPPPARQSAPRETNEAPCCPSRWGPAAIKEERRGSLFGRRRGQGAGLLARGELTRVHEARWPRRFAEPVSCFPRTARDARIAEPHGAERIVFLGGLLRERTAGGTRWPLGSGDATRKLGRDPRGVVMPGFWSHCLLVGAFFEGRADFVYIGCCCTTVVSFFHHQHHTAAKHSSF